MRNKLMTFVSGICFATFCSLSLIANAAEKFELTAVKSNPRIVSRNTAMLTDVPNHEVGQEVQLSELKYSNPAFNVKEEWVFQQFNFVGGSGPHWGTFLDFREDGSQTLGKFEGTQKTVANADGSWVTTWEGTYKYIGGSGKFKNIKGSGTYKGKASSAGDFSEVSKESIEF